MQTGCRIANGARNMNAFARICALFLAMSAFVAVAGAAAAQQPDESVYTISGVSVDETASSASAARDKALAAGHLAAFHRLIDRLVPPEQRVRVPDLKVGDITPMVRSFGIDDEKTSNVRYIGHLTFRFRRDAVRQFLQSRGIGFAETRSKPVLLLPVFDDGPVKRLWDDPNPWFDAWQATPPSDGLVPLKLPAGDLADVQDISAEQAANGETGALKAIGERYGAGTVIVSEAAIGNGPSGRQAVNITLTYYGGPSDGQTRIRSVEIGADEPIDAAVDRAALDIQKQIEESWQRGNQLDFGRLNELVVVVAPGDLREWVEIRQQLRSTAFLKGLQLVAATRARMAVRLSYYGSAEQLRVALAQRDLVLAPGQDSWTLRSSRSAPQPGTAPPAADDNAAPAAPDSNAPPPDDAGPAPSNP